MRCFYHHETQAVGICANCLRGICPDCATDLGDGLACQNRCETRVQARLDLTRAGFTRSGPKANVGVNVVMSLGMLVFALWSFSRNMSVVGLVFLLFAGAFIFTAAFVFNSTRART